MNTLKASSKQGAFFVIGQKKGAVMEIAARINPISYEKPYLKRRWI
jgi:hypothetical protein